MKKLIFTFIIAVLGLNVQAQNNTISKFAQLCQDCNSGKADYPTAGCRALYYLCDDIKSDSKISISTSENTVNKITFAYEHDGDKMYGITAKVDLINKKGITVATYDVGDMHIMNSDSKIVRTFSTKTSDFMTRQLESAEAVLFTFPTSTKFKKRDKLKAKVTILTIEKNTRQLKEVVTFEQKLSK